jgi:DNA-binding MarR family transcriptional regulator
MSLADVLFTPTVQRVLAATLKQPDRTFTLHELLTIGDSGKGSAQRQIERLITAGLLAEEPREGRVRRIRINADHALFAEVRSIALKSFALVEPIRSALLPLARRIRRAFVAGSIEEVAGSFGTGIELIVVGTPSKVKAAAIASALSLSLGCPVSLRLHAHEPHRLVSRRGRGEVIEIPMTAASSSAARLLSSKR